MNKIYSMINNGRIDEIVIFTSASNNFGYVDYIRDCIEIYSDVPIGTINRIISRDKYNAETAPCGATFKDMNILINNESYPDSQNPNTKKCCIVDDKPSNIRNGKDESKELCEEISPYNQYVNPINLIAEMPGWEKDKVNDYLKSANGCLQDIKIDENDKEFAQSKTGISLSTLVNDAKQYTQPWSDEMANDKELLRIRILLNLVIKK